MPYRAFSAYPAPKPAHPLWKGLGVLTMAMLAAGCTQIAPPAVSQPEDNPNNPYAQFRQAVNEVEPLIDPNLEGLTTNRLQTTPAVAQGAVALPRQALLAIQGDLTLVSAPTMQTFNEQMYQRLIQAGYGGVLDINTLRAGAAVQRFCQNPTVGFVTLDRPMTPAEIQTCQGKGRQPLGLAMGKDPLLLVVNKQNDFVRGITLDRLRAILTQQTWSQVDPSWPNRPISRAMIGPDSSTVALLTQTLPEGASLLNGPGTDFYDYPEPMVQNLTAKANGVVFINASIHQRFTQTFKALPINGISASRETVENNAYPLVQSLFLYVDQNQLTSGSPTQAVVNFYLTEMTDVIPEVGLLPLTPAQLDQTKRQWLNATTGN